MSNLENRASRLAKNLKLIKVSAEVPFADKVLPDGRKIFKRIHGVKSTVESSQIFIEFIVPYNFCKITGVELLAGIFGDKVNFKVYDTPNGDISGVPDSLLNQFGFDVYVMKDLHREISNYDADLIKDMKLVIEYTPIPGSSRDIYTNFILHELK